MHPAPNTDPEARVRADRWLWAARLFKTRSLAAKACAAGHVKLEGASIKAARPLRIGDRVEALTPGGPRIVELIALAEKRGPASVARTLYIDHTPEPEPKEAPPMLRDRGLGRPSKRDRRQQEKLRGR